MHQGTRHQKSAWYVLNLHKLYVLLMYNSSHLSSSSLMFVTHAKLTNIAVCYLENNNNNSVNKYYLFDPLLHDI